MQFNLTILVCAVVLLCAVETLPRKYSDKKQDDDKESDNFVYIGSSKNSFKPMIGDDKILRSSPYYSFMPVGYFGNGKPMQIDQHHQHGSLLNLNIHHLLEPFMLITFLVYVLCLLDKAKVIGPLSRLDLDMPTQPIEYEGYTNYLKRNITADF
jgi:hypothetical protein